MKEDDTPDLHQHPKPAQIENIQYIFLISGSGFVVLSREIIFLEIVFLKFQEIPVKITKFKPKKTKKTSKKSEILGLYASTCVRAHSQVVSLLLRPLQ